MVKISASNSPPGPRHDPAKAEKRPKNPTISMVKNGVFSPFSANRHIAQKVETQHVSQMYFPIDLGGLLMLYAKKSPDVPPIGTPLTPSCGQFGHFFGNFGTFLGECKWDMNPTPTAPKFGSPH